MIFEHNFKVVTHGEEVFFRDDLPGFEFFEPGGNEFIVDALTLVPNLLYLNKQQRIEGYLDRLVSISRLDGESEDFYRKILAVAVPLCENDKNFRSSSLNSLKSKIFCDRFVNFFLDNKYGDNDLLLEILYLSITELSDSIVRKLVEKKQVLNRLDFMSEIMASGISDFSIIYDPSKTCFRVLMGPDYKRTLMSFSV